MSQVLRCTGEHTGDVIHTSLSGSKDTDVDGDDTANLVSQLKSGD